MAEQQVVNALGATLSPADAVRKPAEEALKSGSNQRGFVECLVNIIRNQQHDVRVIFLFCRIESQILNHFLHFLSVFAFAKQPTIRLAAIINLKRTVANHWKPRT